ncbi:hypothetical protein PHMEG_00014301 [Phytophthora megakarya]|uniref:Uncharacterized protein n=1 Tax=Phytophthora megakarya TaxID=4795 RepID=A0A225W6P9_9STRA|nr:hypothetical protein PHMEG_00014301 [Phytophthora megakarya]
MCRGRWNDRSEIEGRPEVLQRYHFKRSIKIETKGVVPVQWLTLLEMATCKLYNGSIVIAWNIAPLMRWLSKAIKKHIGILLF